MDPLRQLAAKVADFFAPAAEASHTQDHYEISLELPGVPEENIAIRIERNMLTVSGEKKFHRLHDGQDFFFSEFSYGKFQRSFRLPEDADEDHVKATYTDGVLSITVPKKAVGATGKKIKITKSV
ncbi:Hsp20/alpha crystallin family protein [Magnetovibrio sp.]|uniref:Hsp20/alpha crystallin family protein n=1 Tax=Magnetovibrio sp. TaxID=2024836 RepID=UPI002F949391